jgi:hypothetical protein
MIKPIKRKKIKKQQKTNNFYMVVLKENQSKEIHFKVGEDFLIKHFYFRLINFSTNGVYN